MTWEKARSINITLDAMLFGSKRSIAFDYCQTLRKNILIRRNVSLPDYTGLVLPNKNLGKLSNQGYNFQITHNNTNGPINLLAGTNFTSARNSVKFFGQIPGLPGCQQQTGRPISNPTYGGLRYNNLGIFHTQDQAHLWC